MPGLMRDVLYAKMLMENRNGGVVVFTSRAWNSVFETRGPLVRELILKFLSMLRFEEVLLDLDTPSTIQFQLEGARRHFLGPPPFYTLIRDPVLRLCHKMMAHSIAGPARQEVDAGGVAEEALVLPGGGDKDGEMPQAVPPQPRTQGEKISQLEEEVHGMREKQEWQTSLKKEVDKLVEVSTGLKVLES
nr:hypothetical protein [Tanacetum cinerariifolium]